MFVYWLIFSIPAFASLFERPNANPYRNRYALILFATLLIGSVIGLRYQVGSDWSAYMRHFLFVSVIEFNDIPSAGDPGYVLLNWLAGRLGADVWLVNSVCSGLFCWGLLSFARSQPRPWLALLIAVPYLVIVVAMGYTRQGVAIGLVMRGLVALVSNKSNLRFVFWALAAATFHKSAVLVIPIAALAEDRGRWWTLIWVGGASILTYFVLLESSVESLMYTYVKREYDSTGTAIRVAMNALPALMLLFFGSRFGLRGYERRLWLVLAVVGLAMIPALVLSPSSTAVDRVALYVIPLQLVVLSRLPDALTRSASTARLLAVLVVLYSAAVQFIWLNYASHSDDWLPYQMYPLV